MNNNWTKFSIKDIVNPNDRYSLTGGPFGSEEIVSSVGPFWGLTSLLIYTLTISFPIILVTTELSSALPNDGGYSIWVTEAFGEFWGVQESYWSLVSGIIDNAIYPVLIVDVAEKVIPELRVATWNQKYMIKLALCIAFCLPNLVSVKSVGKMLQFMSVIVIACLFRKDWGGQKVETSWGERLGSLPHLLPPILLFCAVVGSIYGGVATPTEAASIGVVMALIIAACFKTLSFSMLRDAFEGTMRTTAMIMIIVFAAIFLNFVLGFMGITQSMLNFIAALGLTPVETILLLVLFYLLIGMFMETLSMMLTTVPVVFPIVMGLGVVEFSDVWFGILITILMEAALITPPIGVNLYVVQGIRSRGGEFNDVAKGAVPFVFAMLAMIFLLIWNPSLATWLPNLVYH